MIKRQRHSEDFKRRIGLELASGVSSAGEISKREKISSATIYKWRDKIETASFANDEKEYVEQQKRIKELEEIVSDQAIQIHILKKTQKIMEQLKKKERLSGCISPRTLGSK
jgi:transposase-like protein